LNRKFYKNVFIVGYPDFLLFRGKRVVYLPPYSPDYNPIEKAFSKIKASLRRRGTDVRDAMERKDGGASVIEMLEMLTFEVSPQDAVAWFADCGYDTN
jgi:hypothetical protein